VVNLYRPDYNEDEDGVRLNSDALMRRRTVILQGAIRSQNTKEIAERLMALQVQSNRPITLMINSGGGSVYAALDLCDLITHVLVAPVHAVAVGNCHSAATFIMLHCEKRMCTPHSRFIIHSGTMNGVSLRMDETTEKNLSDLLRDSQSATEMIVRMYMRKLKMGKKQVQALINRGDQDFNNALSAQEAMKIGLIQHIETGKLDIFPK
jgi:ATP-dependent Clp protease protease subunit